jgi:hypothetical protein
MSCLKYDGALIETHFGSSENKAEIQISIKVSRKAGAYFLNPCSAVTTSHKTILFSTFSKFFNDHKILDPHHKKLLEDKIADCGLETSILLSSGIPTN